MFDYQLLAVSLVEAVEAGDAEQVSLILATAQMNEEGGPIQLLSALAGVAAVAINSHLMEVPEFAKLYREDIAHSAGETD